MGLYLCVFEGDDEVEGVEVGSYEDFGALRKLIAEQLEGGDRGSRFPVLMLHSDCDGEWSVDEASRLAAELRDIRGELERLPPTETARAWQLAIMQKQGLQPRNLAECFIDVDGEPLFERLLDLCKAAQQSQEPILFQ